MLSNELKVIDGAEAGAWIEPRLAGEFGSVTLEVPKGFEAYARVFHPASDPTGKPVRWAEVAKACGTIPHREMQWHAILGLADADDLHGSYSPLEPTGARWVGSDPPTGAMDIDTLDALCDVLADHTDHSIKCFFGLSTILGWLDSFSTTELPPLLELPDGRDYIVLSGVLTAADKIAYHWTERASARLELFGRRDENSVSSDPAELLRREAPSLIWPTDHKWFVATEVDFDSTLVGGRTELIDAIVNAPKIESWQVEPTDSLAADADKINVGFANHRE